MCFHFWKSLLERCLVANRGCSMKLLKAIDGYIIDCRTRNLSRKTILWYEQKLRYVARWLDEEEDVQLLDSVTIAHVRSFIINLRDAQIGRTTVNKEGEMTEISSLTVKGYVQVIKGFFTWCFNEELIEKSPVVRLQ